MVRGLAPVLFAVVGVACSERSGPAEGRPPAGEPVHEGDPPLAPRTDCDNPSVRTVPEDGDDAVYYLSPVEVELDRPDPTATLVLSVHGEALPGSSTVDGAVVRWDGVLEPETDYRAVLTHACGTELLLFSTSELGKPVEVDLTGRTWALDFANGTWVEPLSASGAMSLFMAPFRILLSVTAPPDGDVVPLAGGVGYEGRQDPCVPTVDLSDSDWDDPHFAVEAGVLELATEEFSVTIEDFTMSGVFSPDGTQVGEATLSGFADTRGLGEAFQLGDGPGVVCEALAAFGAACTACSDGAETCLVMEVEDVSGVLSPVPLDVITTDDVLDNPSCDKD